ncbi:hypothetical protein EGW08_019617 [Elysia chlorotica]|uniref:Uncharacterized protein n=1 Tax=Elysia chlorotica TaxID=188477 RepID=A0A3S0Z9L8_ELYCH|nr:hypothetical protein EGW08_019617 [Elysia chlorotica]
MLSLLCNYIIILLCWNNCYPHLPFGIKTHKFYVAVLNYSIALVLTVCHVTFFFAEVYLHSLYNFVIFFLVQIGTGKMVDFTSKQVFYTSKGFSDKWRRKKNCNWDGNLTKI